MSSFKLSFHYELYLKYVGWFSTRMQLIIDKLMRSFEL